MNVAISVPSVRPSLFKTYLDSLKYLPENIRVFAVLQTYTPEQIQEVLSHPFANRLSIQSLPERAAPYILRTSIYFSNPDIDVWISTDDDFEFLPFTHYEQAIHKVLEKEVGCVSCNWVKHENFLTKRELKDTFIKQKLVYTGGGLVFGRKVVELLRQHPVKAFAFDDIQIPLTAYIHGYENYRYLGSLLIHRIVEKNGLHVLYKTVNLEPPDPRFIHLRPCSPRYHNSNDFFIPVDSDLTLYAKNLHALSKTRRNT